MDIFQFRGEHSWLSNFSPSAVIYEGVLFPSVENAYQAAKAHPSQREPFRHCTAAQSKKLGRAVKIRGDWEQVKVNIMRSLIEQKFTPHTEISEKLKATGNGHIVEGNYWGTYFGASAKDKERTGLVCY